MATDRQQALMACSNYWSSPFQVGSHHLARGLTDHGWQVAFVGDPISPIDFISPSARKDVGRRWQIYRSGGEWELEQRLWSYVPAAIIAPHNRFLLRSGWVHKGWHRFAFPRPQKRAMGEGFEEVDLLYIDSFSQGFWLDVIPHKRSVYRMADLNRFQKRYCKAAEQMERSIIQRVDRVLVPSKHLIRSAEELGAKSVAHFPNGGATAHFANATPPVPEEYQGISKPIAVYMGVMPEWFDFESIRTAARKLPHVSFVLIGPDRLTRNRLADVKNIHILGVRPYPVLPGYLHHAQVGLMPFDVRQYPDVVNTLHPQKLYAYSACGLPTVAFAWEELKTLNSPAILCQDEEEMVAGIERAIQQPMDRQKLLDFAKESDWSNRIPLFLQLSL